MFEKMGATLACCLLLLLSAVPPCSAVPRAAPAKPNIIVILSDDMGYSDLGCYGGEIRTPSLDALAASGVRFTQFYNGARCCPTRASLLTGLYPHQAGVGHMMEDRGLDGYRGDLNFRCATIAEVLKPAGYRNYAIGKWHVTRFTQPNSAEEKHSWPLQRGFDRYYGTIHGAGSYYDPSALTRDNKVITVANDPEYQTADFYYTDAISDHAVRFIREHARDYPGQAFFMYVAYTAAHWPMHAREDDIARYRGRYDAGYESVRAARWEKQKRLGVVNPSWVVSPLEGDWQKVQDRVFEARCMEVYAAMIDRMDQGIGRIVEELKRQGRLDDTLLLFLQDNGGCAETNGRTGPFVPRPPGPTLAPMGKDDVQIGSLPKQTRDGYPVRQGYGVLPGPMDTFIAYGRSWANVSNVPFREYKHWVHEGGISTPLIAHWPRGIGAGQRNRLVPTPGHLIDIMATCVDVAGASYPRERNGQALPPIEGVSLRPLLQGKPIKREQPIFFEHEGNRALRDGKWKLVAKGPEGAWELYDMETDRTEMHNRAAEMPDKVRELVARWETWARRANVIPWIWKPPYGQAGAAK